MVQYLVDKGETPVVAQGIVNRIHIESGGDPGAIGDNGTSFGLAKWHNERAVGLLKYGQATNRSPYDWRTQLDYARHEMEGPERATRERLKQATTPQEAEQIFTASFERPAATPRNCSRTRAARLTGGRKPLSTGCLTICEGRTTATTRRSRQRRRPRELERLLVAKYLAESQAPPQNMHQAWGHGVVWHRCWR
jgi:hypothetical protein